MSFSFLPFVFNNTYADKHRSIEALNEEAYCQEQRSENVGGQAVLEGIMMRHKEEYALAVRMNDGSIFVEHKKWYTFSKSSILKKPFVRGFPILIETLINGIKTLNRSAVLTSKDDEEPITPMQLTMTLIIALFMSIGLFIVLPHGLTYLFELLGLSGSVDSFSFQVWDGLFKFLIFFIYILLISLLPEIRRVFQFHGAEHKVIAAYENVIEGNNVDIDLARLQNRLHPRCGTTFLLFVLTIAIIVHTILLPLFLLLWKPESALLTHIVTLCIKILLMIPISALAYELIRYASKLNSFWGTILKSPGLALQLFTTVEPEDEHLEVALVALKVALGDNSKHTIITTDYIME